MNNDQHQANYDVIISGAGPVGLFLACELALAKCSVLIMEKTENPHSPLKRLPFGIRGLSTPTIEALHRRGLLHKLELHQHLRNPHAASTSAPSQQTSSPLSPRRQVGHFARIPFYDSNIDTSQWRYRLASSTDTNLLSEIQELETVLTERAESLGVVIKRGLAVTALHQTEDIVTAHSGEQLFHSKWLVGCDGSRSVVRKAAGFEFAGTEPEFTGYSVLADLADAEKLSPGGTLTSTGMYLLSQPGYLVMLEFDGGAAHGAKVATHEHVQNVLRRVSNTDVTISALHAVTTWTDRARQATSYRKGRLFLAGDAAHIHSPLGGQGLNLGLGDAMNLGWKLAATIKEKAPQGLLDSYNTERHPIGMQVLDWSRAQVSLMGPGPQARALNAIIRDLMATRDGASYIAARVWGVNTHYDFGGDHRLAGRSVPNFDMHDGVTIGELMRDGHGILLDFNSTPSLQMLASEYPDLLKYVHGPAKDQLGVSVVLIRPDGYIVWATDGEADESAIRQALARWFLGCLTPPADREKRHGERCL